MHYVSGDLNNGLLISRWERYKNLLYFGLFLLVGIVMLYPMFSLAEIQTGDGSFGNNVGSDILGMHRMIKYSEIYTEDAQLFAPEGKFNEFLKSKSEAKPGLMGKWLNDGCIWLGDQVLSALDGFGLNLDRIIFGRIGAGDTVLWTTFAFSTNNPFGIAGLIIFNIVRAICFLFVPQMLIMAVIRLVFSKSPSAISEAKDTVGIVSVLGIAYLLFPFFYELILYVRDLFIFISMGSAKELLGVNTMSIIKNIRTLCDAEGAGIIEGGVYLGFALVTLYFGYIYIMIAMSHAILLGCAPFVIQRARKPQHREKLNEMFNEIGSLAAVPLIDAFIFLIPMIMMKFNAPGLVVLISVAGIPIVRSYARQRLGMGSSSGMMEMAGVGFLMGSLAIARGATRTVKRGFNSTWNHGSEALNSHRKEKMYGEMADRDEGINSNQLYSNMENKNKGVNPFENMDSAGSSGAGPVPNNMSHAKDYSNNSYGGNYTNNYNPNQDIYDKYAKNKNLDDPEFARNVSNRKKAELYKKQKRDHILKGIASTAIIPSGMTGGIIGAAVGSGAGIYGVMQGAGIGSDIGSAISEKIADKIFIPSFQKKGGTGEISSDVNNDVNIESSPQYNVEMYKNKMPETQENIDRVSGNVDNSTYNMEVHTPQTPQNDFYESHKQNLAGEVFNVVTNKDFINENERHAFEARNEFISREINKNVGRKVSGIEGEVSQELKNQFRHDARREVMSNRNTIAKSQQVYHEAKVDHGRERIQKVVEQKYGHAMNANDWNKFNKDLNSSIRNMTRQANASYKPTQGDGLAHE